LFGWSVLRKYGDAVCVRVCACVCVGVGVRARRSLLMRRAAAAGDKRNYRPLINGAAMQRPTSADRPAGDR